eukprot:2056631-Rhodomonas_salina.6
MQGRGLPAQHRWRCSARPLEPRARAPTATASVSAIPPHRNISTLTPTTQKSGAHLQMAHFIEDTLDGQGRRAVREKEDVVVSEAC